jgi:uncharacterized protein
MELTVFTNVNPTEDTQKVLRAVENIFPSLDFKEEGSTLIATGSKEDLQAFKKHLQIQNISSSANSFLTSKIQGNQLEFELNKQAAAMGKVNFVDFRMALGTIKVKIKGNDPQKTVDSLCF